MLQTRNFCMISRCRYSLRFKLFFLNPTLRKGVTGIMLEVSVRFSISQDVSIHVGSVQSVKSKVLEVDMKIGGNRKTSSTAKTVPI